MLELLVLKITDSAPGAILATTEDQPVDVLLIPQDLLFSPDFVAQLEGFTSDEFLIVLRARGLSVGVIAAGEDEVVLYWLERITPELQMTWSHPKDYADAVIRAIQRAMPHPVTITPAKLRG